MEYAILFLPLLGSIIGYFGRSLTKFFSEIITSLFVSVSAILSIIVFWNGIEKNNYNKGDWNINNVSSSFMTAMLNEIVGFRIVVSRTIAKSKLSQNREKEDINNVYKELKSKGFEFLANSMKKL